MMPPFTTYECTGCGRGKRVPEPPTAGPRAVNVGCPDCGFIRRHVRHDHRAYEVFLDAKR